MDKNYNVDDILAEIKRKKSREKAAGSGVPPFGAGAREGAPPSPPAQQRPPVEDAYQLPSVRERRLEPPSQDAHGGTAHFRPVRPASAPPEREPRNPLDPEGHVRPITDKAKIRRDRYSVLDGPPAQEPPPPRRFDTTPPSAAPQEPKRKAPVIDFSTFRPPQEDLDRAAVPAAPPDMENRTRVLPRLDLNRSREFQLEDIQKLDFSAVADSYNDDDYDDEDYDGLDDIIPSAPPVDMGEYNSVADRGAVGRDIARVKSWLLIRCLSTAGLCAALFYLTLAGRYPLPLPLPIFPENNPHLYALAIAVLGIATALVNSSSVGGGLISLFKMQANSDALTAMALLASIGQSVACVVKPGAIDPASLGFYTCVAALSMLFNALGKTSTIGRIQTNFRIIASEKKKHAVLAVESEDFCRQLVRDNATRRPTIAYSVKAGFFTDFLGLSYSDKYDVGINRGVAPACLAGALLVTILSYALTGSSSTAISAFTAILCVSATFTSTFIESIPLGKLTRKLASQGGMVSGNKAVEDFCDTQAVILRERDLFPDGSIQLHGIKAYSHGRIDEAILDAASVVCSTDSTLSALFLQMIGGNSKLLKKVDSLVYENGMGISAWVNSRRVLIGNRQLMEGHGIPLPQDSYGQKYAHQDVEILYLSNSGEVSAQFVISYHIDNGLAASLDHMAAAGKQLAIHSVNPHLTSHQIWELYGYPEHLIEVMPAALHGAFDEMSAPRDTAAAEIAYTGGASMMIQALMACMNTRASILAATIIQMVQIVLGYGLITFIAFMGAMNALNVIQLTVYQLFWFFAIFIVQKVRST